MKRSAMVRFLIAFVLALFTQPAQAMTRPNPAFTGATRDALALGTVVVVSWNDLGMHCMNQSHANLSVLPPFNNLFAQVIRRGDEAHLPQIVVAGVNVDYSVPGNTYSVGKTDFWTYAPALFGVTLAPNLGLTGKGLSGSLDPGVRSFSAHGIPVTPWPDDDLVNEHPFQQALVIARDGAGIELARSNPVIPVSAEIHCVSSGCHASESAILNSHERVSGFDPNARPILCASCHASPALGTTGDPEANYFSFRIHDAHRFLDQSMSGTALCYKCHPGGQAQCLRGAMSVRHGLQCQNCHGSMGAMANGIEQGRIPWAQEPKCATCHLAAYAENAGTLFRNSIGHGGIMCEACHSSTHADVPTRVPADNANNLALQGYEGSLRDCSVCHGYEPAGGGPHGLGVAAVEQEVTSGAKPLRAYPNPVRSSCAIEIPGRSTENGRLILYDMQGRIVRMLEPVVTSAGVLRASWDRADAHGVRVPAGVYFIRWQQGEERAAARIAVLE
jgi:hypothetical protein